MDVLPSTAIPPVVAVGGQGAIVVQRLKHFATLPPLHSFAEYSADSAQRL